MFFRISFELVSHSPFSAREKKPSNPKRIFCLKEASVLYKNAQTTIAKTENRINCKSNFLFSLLHSDDKKIYPKAMIDPIMVERAIMLPIIVIVQIERRYVADLQRDSALKLRHNIKAAIHITAAKRKPATSNEQPMPCKRSFSVLPIKASPEKMRSCQSWADTMLSNTIASAHWSIQTTKR